MLLKVLASLNMIITLTQLSLNNFTPINITAKENYIDNLSFMVVTLSLCLTFT